MHAPKQLITHLSTYLSGCTQSDIAIHILSPARVYSFYPRVKLSNPRSHSTKRPNLSHH